MEIVILNEAIINNAHQVTYRYYPKGECACLAKKITRTFIVKPNLTDLEEAI